MKTNSTQKPEIQKLPDKTFILNLTVPKEEIEKEYQEALKTIQSKMEIKGFRKGKVPLNIVQEKTNPSEIIEDVASHVISHCYSHKVQDLGLKPIIQPKIKLLNPPVTLDKNWEIELTSCELPTIELDSKYVDEIKKINSEEKTTSKLDKILDTLAKFVKVELPSVLIDLEIQNRLSQDPKKNQDLIKSQVIKEWTLNLAIDQIARDQKLEVKPEEVKSLLDQNPNLSSNINFVYYLLIQQKVIQYLENIK